MTQLVDAPGEDLARALALMGEADSVELKLTVPESAQRGVLRALDLDPLGAEIRQVYFFDTPDLALDQCGVVVRARRTQRKGDDTVVKLRPVVPHELPADLRRSRDLVVEVDAMPGGHVCSASLKGVLEQPHVRPTLAGERPLRKLFSKPQRAFFAEHAPEGMTIDDLAVMGPIFVLKLRSLSEGFPRKLVTELWLYPDGTHILELSTKCLPGEAFQVAAESKAYLATRGVDLDGVQQTKTRTALEYFAAQLQT
jgi:hypothetical protein